MKCFKMILYLVSGLVLLSSLVACGDSQLDLTDGDEDYDDLSESDVEEDSEEDIEEINWFADDLPAGYSRVYRTASSNCSTEDQKCEIYILDEKGNKIVSVNDAYCERKEDQRIYSAFSYDDQGRMLTQAAYYNGEKYECESWTYIDLLSKVIYKKDSDCDGVPSFCATSQYDDKGNLIRYHKSFECNDSGGFCEYYLYDYKNRLVSVQHDSGCDGSSEFCKYDGYFRSGGEYASYFEDSGCDGISDEEDCICPENSDGYCPDDCIPYCYIWFANSDGQLTDVYFDVWCDGLENGQFLKRVMDSDNKILYEKYHPNVRNVEDSCDVYAYEYNDAGQETLQKSDLDCDDEYEYCHYQEYDNNGNRVKTYSSDECDLDDIRACRTYIYNEQNQKIKDISDYNCDGVLNDCSYYSYDANGNMLTDYSDRHCDGTIDNDCWDYSYDYYGHQLSAEFSSHCADSPESQCSYANYDARGYLLSSFKNSNCDDIPDTSCIINTYEYY